jgi:hypothetical protein
LVVPPFYRNAGASALEKLGQYHLTLLSRAVRQALQVTHSALLARRCASLMAPAVNGRGKNFSQILQNILHFTNF